MSTAGPDPADPGRRGDATTARLSVLEDRVEDLAVGLDAIETALQQYPLATPAAAADETTAGDTAASADVGDDTRLDMRVLVAWVRENIALLLERRMPQSGGWPAWCQKWWLHPEAIARFEAVRRVWLDAAGQPTGAGLVIYFEHLDQQLAVLCGENGPFSGCTGGRHQPHTTARVLGQIDPDEADFLDLDPADSPPPLEEPPTVWIERVASGATPPSDGGGPGHGTATAAAHGWGPATTPSNGHHPGEVGRW